MMRHTTYSLSVCTKFIFRVGNRMGNGNDRQRSKDSYAEELRQIMNRQVQPFVSLLTKSKGHDIIQTGTKKSNVKGPFQRAYYYSLGFRHPPSTRESVNKTKTN